MPMHRQRLTTKIMEDPIDILNVPAFKRKRSIAARARKTSGEIKISELRPPKRTRTKESRASQSVFNEPLMDIPIQRNLDPESYIPETRVRKSDLDLREMKICGQCEGYFDRINVAVVKLTAPLRAGNSIIFETDTGLFEQTIVSMQINHKDVKLAKSGSDIGLKVLLKPKVGGTVYKVI